MPSLKPPPGRRLTPILAEDMDDSWSVPTPRDPGRVRIVIDRENPSRTTPPPPLARRPRSRRRG